MHPVMGSRWDSVAISAIHAFYPSQRSTEESVLNAQVHTRERIDEAFAGLEEINRRIVVRVAIEDAPLTQVARELGSEYVLGGEERVRRGAGEVGEDVEEGGGVGRSLRRQAQSENKRRHADD